MGMKELFTEELLDFAYKYDKKLNNPHVRKRRERQQEALDELYKRNRTPCKFDNRITSEIFQIIAIHSMHCIPRIISITVSGAKVSGQARSQTERSVSNFIVDFNYYGKINGNFATWSDNVESRVPSALGEIMKKDIEAVLRGESLGYEDDVKKEVEETISAAHEAERKYKERKEQAKARKIKKIMEKFGLAVLGILLILLMVICLLLNFS